jgi:hypothetical protein
MGVCKVILLIIAYYLAYMYNLKTSETKDILLIYLNMVLSYIACLILIKIYNYACIYKVYRHL